jgi:hypothetical protein
MKRIAVTYIAFLVLVGCVSGAVKPQDVISVACAPSDLYLIERCSEAVGDVYSIFQKRALEIVSDPATPLDVKESIQRLDRELTPAVRALVQTTNAYVLLRNAHAPAAEDTRAELEGQLATIQPKVQSLPKL